MKLSSTAPDGIELVKKTLARAEKLGKGFAKITYGGAGRYNVVVKAPDYKIAEKMLKTSTESAIKFIERYDGEGSFERID